MPDKSDSTNIHQLSSSTDKSDHIRICLEKDVESSITNGFERYYLTNNPLPDMDFQDVEISCSFLGKKISAPFLISPITGGYKNSDKINKNLARAAQHLNIVMSVGSQRLALENPSLAATYQVRDVAPDIPLLANLGAIYLNYGYGTGECQKAVEMIEADGLCLYLNPMQKIFQGTNNVNFRDLIKKIAGVCDSLSVPVIVKEVGFGLSAEAAIMLEDAGVTLLDVAGAGGTAWTKITRHLNPEFSDEAPVCFDNWGTPTADALTSIRAAVRKTPLIASGGIRSGIEIAKALALGASFAGMALPLVAPAMESSQAVQNKIERIITELKMAMFSCGSKNLRDLQKGDHIKKLST